MKAIIGAVLTAAAAFGAVQARAQAPGACAGAYQIVRTSQIKPGQLDTFLKAAHDQQAWYVAKGLPDRILIARMLDRQPGAPMSATTVMTIHTGMRDLTGTPHDAGDTGWNAFVSEYRQSADMTDERFVCVSPAG